ncbi:MAG: hypothetical protein LW870_18430 [Pirellula sp.]|nr:hypothetical protein [Pirellula sp.]
MEGQADWRRHTDLAVAIDVLGRLDNANSGAGRVLDRRLAKGALAASRLIEEGVLEQDRRTRQSIRPCLDAACAFTHIDAEHNLSKVAQPNSREWVESYLLTQLTESSHSESVGAAAILLSALGSDHERWEELEEYFNNSTSEHKDAVFECFRSFNGEKEVVHDRVARIVLRRILEEGWQTLTLRALGNCIAILRPLRNTIEHIVRKLGHSKEVADLLHQLLEEERQSERNQADVEEIGYGLIAGVYLRNDWTNEEALPFVEIEDVPGVLKIPYHILEFSMRRTRDAFVSALNAIKLTKQPLLSALPVDIRARFPAFEGGTIPERMLAEVNSMTDQEFTPALLQRRIGDFELRRWALNFMLIRGGQVHDFLQFIRVRPSVAVHVWFGHYFEGNRVFEDMEKLTVLSELGKALLDDVSTCFQFPGLWGSILKSLPNADEVRGQLVAAARLTPPREFFRHPHSFASFELNLPAESSLLPHLLSSVTQLHAFMEFEHLPTRSSHISKMILDMTIKLSGSASLPSVAAQRSIDPRDLRRTLAGDLDWIVMKALEKERSRRYETANGLARDIERFLNEEAVEACPPSNIYRLKKLFNKHRGKVIAASLLVVSVLLGIIGTTFGFIESWRAASKLKEANASLTNFSNGMLRVLEHGYAEMQPIKEGKSTYNTPEFELNAEFNGGKTTSNSSFKLSLESDAVQKKVVHELDDWLVGALRREKQVSRELEAKTYRIGLPAAYTAIKNGELRSAQVLLNELPERLRGWEWNWLMSETDKSLFQTSIPDGLEVKAVSRDGLHCVLIENLETCKTLQVMDAMTGKMMATIDLPDAKRILCVALSKDAGLCLVCAATELDPSKGLRSSLFAWDTRANRILQRFDSGLELNEYLIAGGLIECSDNGRKISVSCLNLDSAGVTVHKHLKEFDMMSGFAIFDLDDNSLQPEFEYEVRMSPDGRRIHAKNSIPTVSVRPTAS